MKLASIAFSALIPIFSFAAEPIQADSALSAMSKVLVGNVLCRTVELTTNSKGEEVESYYSSRFNYGYEFPIGVNTDPFVFLLHGVRFSYQLRGVCNPDGNCSKDPTLFDMEIRDGNDISKITESIHPFVQFHKQLSFYSKRLDTKFILSCGSY